MRFQKFFLLQVPCIILEGLKPFIEMAFALYVKTLRLEVCGLGGRGSGGGVGGGCNAMSDAKRQFLGFFRIKRI